MQDSLQTIKQCAATVFTVEIIKLIKYIVLYTLILPNNHFKYITSTLTCFDHNIAVRVRLKRKCVIKSLKINHIFFMHINELVSICLQVQLFVKYC